MKLSTAVQILISLSWLTDAATSFMVPTRSSHRPRVAICSGDPIDVDAITFSSDEEKKQAVGNLVADDEWMGLGMELSEAIRMAVIEDLKQNARDFLGKDDYKIGDISKEIDSRVKTEGRLLLVVRWMRYVLLLKPNSHCLGAVARRRSGVHARKG